VQESADSIFNV